MSSVFGIFLAQVSGAASLLASTPRIWYAIPLVVVVSLTYGATRHERLREIAVHSFRSAVWVVGFMSIIYFLIWIGGYWN